MRGQRHSFFVIMIVLSTAYVLSLPTVLSAMSGYQTETVPLLPWANTTYINFHDLTPCSAIILDGARVGLTDNYCIPLTKERHANPVTLAFWDCEFSLTRMDSYASNLEIDPGNFHVEGIVVPRFLMIPSMT